MIFSHELEGLKKISLKRLKEIIKDYEAKYGVNTELHFSVNEWAGFGDGRSSGGDSISCDIEPKP